MSSITFCRENNAIDRVAFMFVLSKNFSQEEITSVKELYNSNSTLSGELPRIQVQNSVMIQIGDNSNISQGPNVGGLILDRMLENGKQEWFVSIVNNIIVIGSSKYTRWAEMWGRATEYLNIFMPLFNNSITEIAIEYIDEFIIENQKEKWKEELFNIENDFLPKNIFSIDSFWHIHQGYFTSESQKQLNNINLNYLKDDLSLKNKLIIQTHHKLTLDDPVDTNSYVHALVDKHMSMNHKINKDILVNLLSKSICERLDLRN